MVKTGGAREGPEMSFRDRTAMALEIRTFLNGFEERKEMDRWVRRW